jgi:hypothetical protein
MAVCEVPLSTAEFIKEPRKVVQLDVPMFKPEAHGHLLKLAKARARLPHLLPTSSVSPLHASE